MGDFLGGLPTVLIATAGGYLLGSIPLAYLISKRHSGVDIFEVGTGLPGASNVMRNVGKLPAVMVFLGDMAKGALAILLANVMGGGESLAVASRWRGGSWALEVDVHRLSRRRWPRHLSRRAHRSVFRCMDSSAWRWHRSWPLAGRSCRTRRC